MESPLEPQWNSVTQNVQHDKLRGSLYLNFNDFLVWAEFQTEKFIFHSQPMDLDCGSEIFKFRLRFEFYTKEDDFYGLYLVNDNQQEMKIKYKFSILGPNKTSVYEQETTHVFPPNLTWWGFPNFVLKKKIKRCAKSFLPDGCLSIRCDLEVYKTVEDSIIKDGVGQLNKASSLTHDMTKLWKDGNFSDFLLVCGDQTFPCHKNILAYRSNVFEAMFSHATTEEARTSQAVIKDCEPETLSNFLEFIYTDQLEDEKGYDSTELLLLADKYNVKTLRTNCESALVKSLDSTNAINLLSFASLITAPALSTRAAKFILCHSQELYGTKEWKEMIVTNPSAMDELFKFKIEKRNLV